MSGLMQPVKGAQSSAASGSPPTLRPYQSAAIYAIREHLLRVRSTLLVAATGTGKTVTFAELARHEVQRGNRVLILVHRDELIKQARRKCEAVGLYPDVEKGSKRAGVRAKVVIASVQSLRGKRLLRWARDHFALIIIDEAHHAPAASYQGVVKHFDGAKIVGVTATPARQDGKALGDTFDTVAFVYDIRAAIADQWLVPIVARRVVVDSIDLREVTTRAGDFAQDELGEVMADERALRGQATPLLELARDRPTIAFCVNVKHAEGLARTLNALRPGCARAVWGDMDDADRERLLAEHEAGVFQILTNCDLLVEGYDSPRVACVANCRPTQSWARYVQQAGRGLRLLGDSYAQSVANGKRDCLLLDLTGIAGANHALIGPADCLAEAGEIPDDVREEIERQLATAQLDIGKVMSHAIDEIAKRRAAMKLAAVVRWHSEHIDPFLGEAPSAAPPPLPHWANEPASAGQLDAIAEFGINVEKLPPLTRADAWNLLVRLKARRRDGLCSLKMAKRLKSLGVRNTETLSSRRANELRDICLEKGWHPNSLRNEPECRDAFPLRVGGVS